VVRMGTVASEAAVVTVSYFLTVGYIVYNLAFRQKRNVASRASAVRRRFVAAMLKSKPEAILAVQAFRNFVMGSSFLATAMAGAAFLFVDYASDPTRIAHMNETVLSDPLTARTSTEPVAPVISASVKLYVAVALSFFSFFFMTQNIRIVVHLGFFIRAAVSSGDPEDETYHLKFRDDTLVLVHRAGLFFLLGLRPFYILIPTVAWILGPTYLLVASIVLTLLLYFSDTIKFPGVRTPEYPGEELFSTECDENGKV